MVEIDPRAWGRFNGSLIDIFLDFDIDESY
jgi:hypothetical protein